MATDTGYVDSSIVLNALYHLPGESPLSDRSRVLTSSELLQVEVALSIDRRLLAGQIGRSEAALLRKEGARIASLIHLFPVSDDVLRFAMEPFPIAVQLKTALHVATAQLVRSEVSRLTFWTHDEQVGAAALARGLELGHLGTNS